MKTEDSSEGNCISCGGTVRIAARGLCSRCVAGGLFSSLEDEEVTHSLSDEFEVVIPGHEIEEKIADTGLSQVYRGWQLEPRREVAIKVLRRNGRDDARLHERFEQEVKIGARLGGQGCVQVFDSGFANDSGVVYFTMELMRGGTICEYAKKRKLAAEDRVRLFLPLCSTVAAAHQVPILHRDLKPGNVLATKDGKVKLGDFGLAKFLEVGGEGITLQGGFAPIGTPVYMSPEQARGEVATTLSDVYGLGAVLYELLTEERPFSEEGGSLTTMARVAGNPMRSPLGIHPDLKAIVERAMAKSPAERYQTATGLENDLKAFLSGDPVAARRGQSFYSARKKLRKYWLGITTTCLVVALFAGGSFFHLQRLAERNEVAEAAYSEARSLLATMVINTARELTNVGRADAAEGIAIRALKFNWDLPIKAQGEDAVLTPEYLRMEVYALNAEVALGYRQAEKAADFFRKALAESKEWLAPPEMDYQKSLGEIKYRANLVMLKPSGQNEDLLAKFLEFESSVRDLQTIDQVKIEESLILRARFLQLALQGQDSLNSLDDETEEVYLCSLESLEMEIDALLAKKSKRLELEIARSSLADARREILGILGEGNLEAAIAATNRWKALHIRNGKNIGVGHGRLKSLGRLALVQARTGSLEAATQTFEAVGNLWASMRANRIFGYGTAIEEELVESGVELMGLCNPTRPELTLRVVDSCRSVFNYLIPRVHRDRAVGGFIPPELWPQYADGRKFEARACLALGKLDRAWGAYSGSSGRWGELCKMSPNDPEPLLRRCELVGEWATMPAPPKEPSHPARVVAFLKGIVVKAGEMDLDSGQQARLKALNAKSKIE